MNTLKQLDLIDPIYLQAKCNQCEKIFHPDHAHCVDEQVYCEDCFHDEYMYCTDCGRPCYIDDTIVIEFEEYSVCTDCLDNYIKCDHCQNYYSSSMIISDNYNDICEGCFSSDYSMCASCGDILYYDDCLYSTRHDSAYCESCYPDENTLPDWDYSPNLTFYGNGKLFLGLELELETCYIHEVTDYMETETNRYFMKKDGSLSNDGLEFVTHPMTLEYHKHKFDWDNILNDLNDAYVSRNCGMHIHASKNYLSDIERVKLGIFIHTNRREIEYIARRTSSHYAKYKTKDKLSKYKANSDRYEAVNFTRNTIEFRMFYSTKNVQEILYSLEFVHACMNFVKTVSTPKIVSNEAWGLFLNYVRENRKKYNYLDEKLHG